MIFGSDHEGSICQEAQTKSLRGGLRTQELVSLLSTSYPDFLKQQAEEPQCFLSNHKIKITQKHYLYVKGEYQLELAVKLRVAGQVVLLRCAQECLNVVQGNVNPLS